MITALVQFRLRDPISLERAREAFSKSAPKYEGVPGLLRKYFTVAEDGCALGGVYLWRSKEDAERFYSDAWKTSILEKYGSLPSIAYFHSPVIVENAVPREGAGA